MIGQIFKKLKQMGLEFFLNVLYPLILKHRAGSIGKKDKIEVVFFAVNLAMWRYQGVFDLLSRDKRFNCHIVFTVAADKKEQMNSDLRQMREYFGSREIAYVDYDEKEDLGYDVKGKINPDILFYPQPYGGVYPKNHEFDNFKNKLWCYIPYGTYIIEDDYQQYDMRFHNLAWRVFCPFQLDKDRAKIAARNHGRNWVVSGYYMLDQYVDEDTPDVWKIKDRKIKRLIWAPHFTMSKVSWIEPQSNFLWMSQLMLDVAEQYKGRLQIAFKPHPRLKSELYHHPDWGKERTDKYYQHWENLSNTQLETGAFIDLFKTSDAMIHDCGSFTVEYLFVNKPVAFVTQDIDAQKYSSSIIGQGALEQHYVVGDEKEVMAFINDVVIGEIDSKAPQRTQFFDTILKPNVTGKASEVIVDDIKKGLRLS